MLRAPCPSFSHPGGFCMVWMPRVPPGVQDQPSNAGDTISTTEPCASTPCCFPAGGFFFSIARGSKFLYLKPHQACQCLAY